VLLRVSAEYTKLYCNAVSFNDLGDKVESAPRFVCPNCKAEWEPKQQFASLPDRDLDVNSSVVFQCPKCAAKIMLYVAVHKDVETAGLCLSAESISGEWWKKP
jgi:predicted RNA-binding Zn-ribbon protein involved in translation (DUF1610 family)